MLASRFDLFIVSILGTPVDVGIYAVAYKMTVQGQMLRNVNAMAFFPIFVKRFQQGRVSGKKMVRYGLGFFLAVLVASAIVSHFCVDLVTLLLGQRYRDSGKVLSVLVFYLAAIWGTLPFTVAAQATNNENLMLKIRTVMAAFNVLLDYVLFKIYGLTGIAYCTLIVWGFGSLAMCILPYRAMRRQGYLGEAT
jgi:O-antigen/teichoic acid export membrane protein